MTDPFDRPVFSSHDLESHEHLAPSSKSPSISKSHSGNSFLRSWNYDILSWIGSCFFFIAIIAVLQFLHDRPIPKLSYGLTPNAILGLLATFMELLLIVPVNSTIGQVKWLRALREQSMDDFRAIDEASRGAWGSSKLLAQRKGGPYAAFGAIITIVALGTSTFVQQTLKYETRFSASSDALIPAAQSINGAGIRLLRMNENGMMNDGVDPVLSGTPYLSIFSPVGTRFDTTATCKTGNCTWEPYQTLGFCNTCQNLSATVNVTTVNVTHVTSPVDSPDQDIMTINTTQYLLPNGFGLTGQDWSIFGDSESGVTDVMTILTTALLNITTNRPVSILTDDTFVWDSIAFKKNGSKVMSVMAVGASPNTLPAEPSYGHLFDLDGTIHWATPVAFECMLQYCIRTMRAEFSDGVLRETEISRWTNDDLQNSTYKVDVDLQYPGSEKNFTISSTSWEGYGIWLTSVLQGNVTAYVNNDQLESLFPSSEVLRAVWTAMNSSASGFPDLMDNLANGLTQALRSLPYQTPIVGQAFTASSHAIVQWPWLILPAVELIGSLIMLIIVLVETQKQRCYSWSNNVLPFFFHGLDERPLNSGICRSQEAMQIEAKKLFVEFRPNDEGGRLVILQN